MPASQITDSRDLVDELRTLVGDELHPDPELVAELDDDERERMAALVEVLDDMTTNCDEDPAFGITMIPEDDFTDYARQYAEDVCAIPDDVSWPLDHIDWPAAAEALKVDYVSIDFDGTTYLCR
jgi:hypothetical protein